MKKSEKAVKDAVQVIEEKETSNKQNVSSFEQKLFLATHFDENSTRTIVKGADGKDIELVQKKYSFVNTHAGKDNITITDTSLIASIERIKGAVKARNLYAYAICRELYNIKASGKVEKLGFDTIADFSNAMFGFKRSTTSQYARIGEYFLNADYTPKVGLPDLNVGHFVELMSLMDIDNPDYTVVLPLFQPQDGKEPVLYDGMTTKSMRDAINNYKKSLLPPVEEEQQEEEQQEEEQKEEEQQQQQQQQASSQLNTQLDEKFDENAPFDKQVELAKILSWTSNIQQSIALLDDNGVFDVEVIRKLLLKVNMLHADVEELL